MVGSMDNTECSRTLRRGESHSVAILPLQGGVRFPYRSAYTAVRHCVCDHDLCSLCNHVCRPRTVTMIRSLRVPFHPSPCLTPIPIPDNRTTTNDWSIHVNGTQSIAACSCICAERGDGWDVEGWNTQNRVRWNGTQNGVGWNGTRNGGGHYREARAVLLPFSVYRGGRGTQSKEHKAHDMDHGTF